MRGWANPTNTHQRAVLYAALLAKENRSNTAYECPGAASLDYRGECVHHAFSGLGRRCEHRPGIPASITQIFRLDPRESLDARLRRSLDGRCLWPTGGLAGGPDRGSARDVARRAHDGNWLPCGEPL